MRQLFNVINRHDTALALRHNANEIRLMIIHVFAKVPSTRNNNRDLPGRHRLNEARRATMRNHHIRNFHIILHLMERHKTRVITMDRLIC